MSKSLPKLRPQHPGDADPEQDQAHPSPETDLLTVREAASYLRCSKSYLDKLRCSGGGPEFVRLGMRKILYRRSDLSNWARVRRFDSTSQYLK
jgi:excisionase family DNA binding protein